MILIFTLYLISWVFEDRIAMALFGSTIFTYFLKCANYSRPVPAL